MMRLALAATLALLGGGCGRAVGQRARPEEAATIVKVGRPQTETIRRVLRLPGTARPLFRVELRSRVSGYVGALAVDRGDRVRQGQVLLRIHVPEMAGELARARAARVAAAAELQQAEAQSARLAAAAQASAAAVAPAQLEAAAAAVAVARGRLQMARAEIRRLEALAADAVLRAPFDAVVTDRRVDPGALVQAGHGGGAGPGLLTLEQQDRLRVLIDVPEADVGAVRVGAPVKLEARALRDRMLAAKVSRLSSSLEVATRTMKVEVEVPNPTHEVLPGMDVTVTFDLGARVGATTVPPDVVLRDAEGPFVWVVEDGCARRRRVRLGIDTGARIEIRDGLRPDDRLVLWGQALLVDGRRLEARP